MWSGLTGAIEQAAIPLIDDMSVHVRRVAMQLVFPSAADRDRVIREFGAVQGGKQTLSRLADYLATM